MKRSGSFLLCALAFLVLAGCRHTRPDETSADEATGSDTVEIGYGTQDKAKVTGSVSSADVRDASETPTQNIEDWLQGRVSGAQVLNTPNGLVVRIRGVTSPTGSNAPLYVIDGTPTQAGPGGALTGINPYDIESIDVLKGAAAAIYGMRAANGVVLIKTRRGNR